jgi:hypothetical protein
MHPRVGLFAVPNSYHRFPEQLHRLPLLNRVCEIVWCCRQIGRDKIVTVRDLAIGASCGFPQLGAENVYCHHYGPVCLVHRGPGWSIPRHEEAQFHRASAQSVKSLEALHKPLSRANGSEPSSASEAVADGDVTALDGLSGVTATPRQPRAYVAGEWNDRGQRFHIRLVMISNDCFGRDICTDQCLTEKRFRTGPISFVAQEYINDLSVFIYCTI